MTTPYYQAGPVTVFHGDCIEVMRELPDASVDAVATDPPYGIRFMGKEWDGADIVKRAESALRKRTRRDGRSQRADYSLAMSAGTYDFSGSANQAFQEWCTLWAGECLRVLKPGGHLLAFGGSRTWHRLASGIEDAGFEIRDSIAWLYGSGFPKSLDVSKAIDKRPGVTRHDEFKAELIAAREARGMSRSELAEAIVGTESGAVWNWEHHQFPSARWWPKLRDLLGMDGEKWDAVIAEAERVKTGSHSSGLRTGAAGLGGDGEGGDRFDTPTTDAARAWEGWGTALKPSFEPVVVARKPLAGTVAANVLTYGTGALNIDATRMIPTDEPLGGGAEKATTRDQKGHEGWERPWMDDPEAREAHAERVRANVAKAESLGRWPTNVVLDESQAAELDRQSGVSVSRVGKPRGAAPGEGWGMTATGAEYDDAGGASRFFPTFRYEAKAPTSERPKDGDTLHPTVKPLDLMRWLVRLVTPPGGTVLEPFAGSGTTLEACVLEGFECIGIEREADYLPLIVQRLSKDHQVAIFDEPRAAGWSA